MVTAGTTRNRRAVSAAGGADASAGTRFVLMTNRCVDGGLHDIEQPQIQVTSSVTPSLKLDLADGQRWVICPVDSGAESVVVELGRVMQLEPACRSDGPRDAVRTLYVAASGETVRRDRVHHGIDGAVVCCIPQPANPDLQAIGLALVAEAIARESLLRGGLLLHGALAERGGSGFVMAGPGTVGKSTASRRLPAPWLSLSDDMTLVVRDGRGGYLAHPWPTWSRFHAGGPGGSWPVERAVPLRAVFFLSQSPSDKLEPVGAVQATALLLDSDFSLTRAAGASITDSRSAVPEGIEAAKALAAAVPAYKLELSLDGQFWNEIERVLPVAAAPPVEDAVDRCPGPAEPRPADGSLRLVYTGNSMYPTLVDPELLEVESYGDKRVCPGDIVCFRLPTDSITVVHRVVAVGSGGIRTRGDNNAADDPDIVPALSIIGRVRAVQRGARRRVVSGGWRSLAALACARLGRGVWRRVGLVPRALYRFLSRLGPFDWLLPARLRPRLVRFDARYRVFLKLLSGGQVVGQYDDRRREWRIRRPFYLFVKLRTLGEAVAGSNRS